MDSMGTILVIDDSSDDLQLLLRTFSQLDIQNPVHTCSSADEAIAYLETRPVPAVILLDLKMPGRDGFYVLRWVRTHREWSDLIVVVLTTSFDVRDIQLAYELGVNSFLTKPVNLTRFKDMIGAFHQYWIVHAQPAPARLRVMQTNETAA
jgi:two-component system, response regulator